MVFWIGGEDFLFFRLEALAGGGGGGMGVGEHLKDPCIHYLYPHFLICFLHRHWKIDLYFFIGVHIEEKSYPSISHTWKTVVTTLIFHQLLPLKPAIQLPKNMVHTVFQVDSEILFFLFHFFWTKRHTNGMVR